MPEGKEAHSIGIGAGGRGGVGGINQGNISPNSSSFTAQTPFVEDNR